MNPVLAALVVLMLVFPGLADATLTDNDPLGRALTLEADGRHGEGLALLEREGSARRGTEGAALILSAARMALRAGDENEARRLAGAALPVATGNGRVALEAARILRSAGAPREALELAARAASTDPTVRFAAQELRFDIMATMPGRPTTPGAPGVASVLAGALAVLAIRAWWPRLPVTPRHIPGTPLEPGQQVGNWIVERAVSQSLHARLYRGRHVRNGSRVAIKQALVGGRSDDPAWARFRQEMNTLEAVGRDEPGIPRLAGTIGHDIIVNAWVEGETFEALAGRIAWDEALVMGVATARTLARLHARGVIHRDIKPANLMREQTTGRPMILDFGIARLAAGEGLTVDAALPMGTFGFMAPEQFASASQAGPAADQYGLALTLYWLLTGRMPTEPWLGPRTFQYVSAEAFLPPQPPAGMAGGERPSPERVAAIGAVLARAWQERSDDRFPDLDAFADALERIRSTGPRRV
jgi:hypothetical protein